MYPPYIPPKDSEFLTWLVNFANLALTDPTTYGLTAGQGVIIDAAAQPFITAYPIAIDPLTRTPTTVATKDAARASAEAVIRPYAVQISLAAGVTPADKLGIGVNVPSTVPTPIPPPATAPELTFRSAIPGQQTLDFAASGAAGKAKPFGVIGLEVFTAIDPAPVADPTLAAYKQTVTKSPFRTSFTAPQAGQTCTYFARWVTRSGPEGVAQKGPWSPPLSVVVM